MPPTARIIAPTCYNATMGDWFVWYKAGPINRAPFGPNISKSYANFTDGLSNTMVFAECQVEHNQFRSCSLGPLDADQLPQHAGLAGPDRHARADMHMATTKSQHHLGQRQHLRQRHDHGAHAQYQGHPARATGRTRGIWIPSTRATAARSTPP